MVHNHTQQYEISYLRKYHDTGQWYLIPEDEVKHFDADHKAVQDATGDEYGDALIAMESWYKYRVDYDEICNSIVLTNISQPDDQRRIVQIKDSIGILKDAVMAWVDNWDPKTFEGEDVSKLDMFINMSLMNNAFQSLAKDMGWIEEKEK